MKTSVWRAVVLAAAAASAGCPGCGEGPGAGLSTLVPLLTPSERTLDFGAVFVGRDAEREVMLDNSGGAPASIDVVLSGSDGFSLSTAVPDTVAAGDAVALGVRFTPLTPGAATAELTVQSDAENAPTITLTLLGEGVEQLDCDDDNPCTDDVFNFDTGACERTFNEDPCETGNPCLESGRCVDGACLGQAVACEPSAPCMTAFCESGVGCTELPTPGSCADDDPCTDDICSAGVGCTHPTASDFTLCGANEPCVQTHVCLSGTCTAFTELDGFPCSDGDVCTVEDQCQAGACVGQTLAEDPAVVATVPLIGAQGVFLPDGRHVAWRNTLAIGRTSLPFVELVPSTAGLEVGGRLEVPLPERWHDWVITVLELPDLPVAMVRASHGASDQREFGLIDFTVEGAPVLHDWTVGAEASQRAWLLGEWLVVCNEEATFVDAGFYDVYDLTDLAAPILVSTTPFTGRCTGDVVDVSTGSLLHKNELLLQRFTVTAAGALEQSASRSLSPSLGSALFAGSGVVLVGANTLLGSQTETAGELIDGVTLEPLATLPDGVWNGAAPGEIWGRSVDAQLARLSISGTGASTTLTQETFAVERAYGEIRSRGGVVRVADRFLRVEPDADGALPRFIPGPLAAAATTSVRQLSPTRAASTSGATLEWWDVSDANAPEVVAVLGDGTSSPLSDGDLFAGVGQGLLVRKASLTGASGLVPFSGVQLPGLPVVRVRQSANETFITTLVDATGDEIVANSTLSMSIPPELGLFTVPSGQGLPQATVDGDVLFTAVPVIGESQGALVLAYSVAEIGGGDNEMIDLPFLGAVFVPITPAAYFPSLVAPDLLAVDGVLAFQTFDNGVIRAWAIDATDPTALNVVTSFECPVRWKRINNEGILCGNVRVPLLPGAGIIGEPEVLDDSAAGLLQLAPAVYSGDVIVTVRDAELVYGRITPELEVVQEQVLSFDEPIQQVWPVRDRLYAASLGAVRVVSPPCVAP